MLWKKKLQLIISCDGSSPKLRCPLGQLNAALQISEWDIVYSNMSGQSEIFCRQPNGEYEVYGNNGGSSGKYTSVSSELRGRVDKLPVDAVPASLGPRRKDRRERVIFRHQKPCNSATQDIATDLSFASYVRSQDDHIRRILQHADVSNERAAAVAKQIHDDAPLYGGTDGGLMEGKGNFGFVWATDVRSEILVSGKGNVPGHTHGMSSTRAELCGIFAALTYLQLVTQYQHIVPRRAR